MKRVDRWLESSARGVARRTSRRSFLARLGALLVGGATLPLLPVARARAGAGAADPAPDAQDPTRCDYWRYCALEGFLCGCCGGGPSTCPPGTEVSPLAWLGTCRNPADGRDYVISYHDCCGKGACGRCGCGRHEGVRPLYGPSLSNDLNWCVGSKNDVMVHCTTAVLLGPATDAS